MRAVLQTIRLLVIILFIDSVCCQDGYSDRDILRLHQIASNDGQIESLSSYSNNLMQRDQSSQSIGPVSVQYQMTDEADKSDDYNRGDRGRSKKVYRIKNPFQQRQLGDDVQQQENNAATQDTDPGASNQYAAMQYSLPPEEFLQQMRENPFFQQQQQVSTQAPNMGYTATPQPPYQYSTIAASGYDVNNQQTGQMQQQQQQQQQQQLETKMSNPQNYRAMSNSYQYNGGNSYIDTIQSTPPPLSPYVSTSLPSSQFVGTPSNNYVSSSSPMFLSSQPNMQYVSSSITAIQAGTPDYNKGSSTVGSNTNYENNEQFKKMQIDHYDNSANGIRYPINMQQYQNEYPTSTPAPSSTQYPDQWQNNMNGGSNSISKPRQDTMSQYLNNYPYNRNPQENRLDNTIENETHRAGNVAAANNLYLNFVQPDYQVLANLRSRTRDVEQETSQPEYYSHGEYGWKLGGGDKKPSIQTSYSSTNNYPRYQALNSQPEGVAVSQMSFHMDTGKQQSYNHISKSAPDTTDPQEFAKAAAKAHENMKQRQQLFENTYGSNYNQNNPLIGSSTVNSYYNDKYRNKFYSDSSSSSPYYYNGPQQDLITVPPYYYANSRENSLDDKPKQPFDHDKALKNIVPIDVSNVVGENQQKSQAFDANTRYSFQFKEQNEPTAKPNYKSIADSFYQDKNAAYGFNIKPKPEEVTTDGLKLLESNYYNKAQSPEQYFSQGPYADNKRFSENSPHQASYITQSLINYQDSVQSPANVQQQGLQRPQQPPTDISSILKLNDIPYRLTQNIPAETYRMHSGNYEPAGLPSPLPLRLNQNVGNHQLDITNDILNRLAFSKHQALNMHRPENDPQSAGLLSTIHGFKVANPFNVDLKLVADVLKGKPSIDETQISSLRDQFNKPAPLKLDFSQLQQLMGANGNLGQLPDGIGAYSSPYIDIYNGGRYPYQGVKYSRSQEEEESIIPIADASNTHPIGAVIEQDDPGQVHEGETGTDVTGHDDDTLSGVAEFSNDRPKTSFSPSHKGMGDRRHPNSLLSGRHHYQRKVPKSELSEPYPLLKPPPPHSSRSRDHHSIRGSPGRRRRVRRPKVRVFKREPLFESESESEDNGESEVLPILLRPPPVAEAKSDLVVENKNESS